MRSQKTLNAVVLVSVAPVCPKIPFDSYTPFDECHKLNQDGNKAEGFSSLKKHLLKLDLIGAFGGTKDETNLERKVFSLKA